MLSCWIDDTDEQDQRVLMQTLAQAGDSPGSVTEASDDLLVCRQIWLELSQVWIIIPYALRIRFQSAENRKNPDMFLDLIRTHTAINQFRREQKSLNGMPCVIATIDDFDRAVELFLVLNGTTGGQGTKLTRRETGLIEILSSYGQSEITIAQMQRLSGWKSSCIAKLMHGYRSYGKKYSGLLEKCPAISYLDRTVTKGDDGKTTMRRTTAYLWDIDLYLAWKKGGGVWLASEDEPGQDPHDGDGPDEFNSPEENNPLNPPVSEDNPEIFGTLQADQNLSPESSDHACSLSSISPGNFVLIDGLPEREPCSVCGKMQVQYRERRSAARKRAAHGRRSLCSTCYNHAVSREVASKTVLPGVVDTHALVHREVCVGTCDICGIKPAVWSDPTARTKLCEACYEHENLKEGSANQAGSSGSPESDGEKI